MSGNIQSVNTEDDAMMDDAGGNEWLDEDEDEGEEEDEDQASPEDSSSSAAGQAPANTAQGLYIGAIL